MCRLNNVQRTPTSYSNICTRKKFVPFLHHFEQCIAIFSTYTSLLQYIMVLSVYGPILHWVQPSCIFRLDIIVIIIIKSKCAAMQIQDFQPEDTHFPLVWGSNHIHIMYEVAFIVGISIMGWVCDYRMNFKAR